MHSIFRRVAIAFFLGSLHLSAATASTFEGVQDSTYCLRGVCLGAPLSTLPTVQKALAGGGRLTENPCVENVLTYTVPFDADGVELKVTVVNDPDRQGKPVGEYYRVAHVKTTLKTPLPTDQYQTIRTQLLERMLMPKGGVLDIETSFVGFGRRRIILRTWPEAFDLYLDGIYLNQDELRQFQNAPGCKPAPAPDI